MATSWKILLFALSSAAMMAVSLPLAEPEATRLKTGEFLYSDWQNGKELGHSRIAVAKLADGTYRFSNEAIGYADQKWNAITTASFTPVSAELAFGSGDKQRQVFDIRYNRGRVSGFYIKGHGADAQRIAVDSAVPPGIIDQRIDWAAVMASKLVAGQKFAFKVYDPAIATSNAVADVKKIERIQVPAGKFEAIKIVYRIEKATGTEQYTVFTNSSGPRMLIREDFSDGTSSLLVKAS